MSIFEALLQHDHVPNFYRVENTRSAPKLEDVAAETRRVMQESGTLEQLKPGQSVCIAAGSREIANIALIVRTVCEVVREHGAEPFIIPAMGSHAGAQAEGQKKILADFGITEEYTGAPIRSSMETVQVGVTKPHGFPARIDRYAAEAEWIIPIGRIKPHTDIRGPIQSGILKMIVIGMGKQFGADICHAEGFPSMSQNIVEIGLEIIANTNILCGMASMENGYHETYRVVAVAPDKILETEKELLPDAAAQLFGIPYEKLDLLIVDWIGKNISGAGMDPNVTGRSAQNGISRPFAERIVARDLTDEAHHNATGMGNADVTTRRLFDKIDMEQTYPNSLTSRDINGFRIPIVMENDNLAIRFALHTITGANAKSGYRAMWIRDTNHVQTFYVTERLLADTAAMPWLRTDGVALRPVFGADGYFTGWERA